MATTGLNTIYLGLKELGGDNVIADADKGLSETGVYEIDTSKKNGNLGVKSANITDLAGNLTQVWGNNVLVDFSRPDAAPKVAIDANAINNTVKQKILGRVSDGKGGWADGDETVEVGLIAVTENPITHKKFYCCFGRGIMTEGGNNLQTNTNSAEQRADDSLSYSALGYSRFNNGKAYKVFDASEEGFDEKNVFDEVFPGQKFIDGTKTTTPTHA